MQVVIFRGNAPSFLRADEPAVHHAACEPGAAGLHPADRPGEGILSQRHAEIRNNLCRRIEVIEEPHHTRTEHVTAAGAQRRLVSGKPEEVIALVMREAQRQREEATRALRLLAAHPQESLTIEVSTCFSNIVEYLTEEQRLLEECHASAIASTVCSDGRAPRPCSSRA